MKTYWTYQDAIGVKRRGLFQACVEFSGTDVAYKFLRDDGTVDVVSGARLKLIKREAAQ